MHGRIAARWRYSNSERSPRLLVRGIDGHQRFEAGLFKVRPPHVDGGPITGRLGGVPGPIGVVLVQRLRCIVLEDRLLIDIACQLPWRSGRKLCCNTLHFPRNVTANGDVGVVAVDP